MQGIYKFDLELGDIVMSKSNKKRCFHGGHQSAKRTKD